MSSIAIHVVVESLRKDEREILRGIEWTVRRGEHWALVGPNGSGKTSLLRIVSGYDWPSRGTVEVLGGVFGEIEIRELRKRIGIVSTSLGERIATERFDLAPAIDVAVSGIDSSVGLWRTFDENERERAREALSAVGALHLERQRFERLSQGEKQRVIIARALVNRPELLILDEACAGLDPVARESFLRDLDTLAARENAPTMIVVSHHPEEIPTFASHALLLKDGRAVASGPIEDVFTNERISEAFGAPCLIERERGRFSLTLCAQA
jgi:iron complex transport system ATP-binding protein